jgi:hypothetical protein
LPDWLDEKFYSKQIQPRLGDLQVRVIQFELRVSDAYALRIREGSCIPHRRHWEKLARLVNIQGFGHVFGRFPK